MYSNAYVWSRVLSYLEQHSPAIAIASYFDDAEVIELTESKLVIYSPSPFRKDVIVKRYIDQIREAMRDQFQTEVEVVVLDETELPQYSKNKKNRNFVEFNSQYTFDKFVVGSSNQHAFPPPAPSRITPPMPITPCLSTASPASARRTCSMPSPTRSSASTRTITSSTSRATSSQTS